MRWESREQGLCRLEGSGRLPGRGGLMESLVRIRSGWVQMEEKGARDPKVAGWGCSVFAGGFGFRWGLGALIQALGCVVSIIAAVC